ncbi:hypothetical protein TNCV_1947351 [Trichonephila clavipes]|nr:hypothetical protein TNCV_1947351 [Trichonephila clavipes]
MVTTVTADSRAFRRKRISCYGSVAVRYLYELVPTSREDDRFGGMVSILASFVRSERKVLRSNLPSDIGDPGRDMIRATVVAPSIHRKKQPSRQTLTQISRYFSKPSNTNDAILKLSRTMTQLTK